MAIDKEESKEHTTPNHKQPIRKQFKMREDAWVVTEPSFLRRRLSESDSSEDYF